jgi:hypothetical protein
VDEWVFDSTESPASRLPGPDSGSPHAAEEALADDESASFQLEPCDGDDESTLPQVLRAILVLVGIREAIVKKAHHQRFARAYATGMRSAVCARRAHRQQRST